MVAYDIAIVERAGNTAVSDCNVAKHKTLSMLGEYSTYARAKVAVEESFYLSLVIHQGVFSDHTNIIFATNRSLLCLKTYVYAGGFLHVLKYQKKSI